METALKAFFSSPRFAVAGASSGECLTNVNHRTLQSLTIKLDTSKFGYKGMLSRLAMARGIPA